MFGHMRSRQTHGADVLSPYKAAVATEVMCVSTWWSDFAPADIKENSE